MPATRILVVEDEMIVAKDIENTLVKLGYEVVATASSGEEAIAAAVRLRPDLVLMDILLKGPLDGIDTALELRARCRLPIVYLTAYADDQTLERAKVTQPYGYILKPFEERELTTMIEMAVYKHSMESRLKEHERWLATTLRSIGDAVIATDRDARIVFLNSLAERLTGWTNEDAAGLDLSCVFNVIDEFTREPAVNPARQVLEEGKTLGLGSRCLLVDRTGATVPVDDSAAPIIDEDGRITGVVLVFRDVTARKQAEAALRQSEENYRQLVERSPDAIVVHCNGVILFINEAGLRLFELSKNEQAIGRSIFGFIHPDQVPFVRTRVELMMRNESVPVAEETFKLASGRCIDCEVSAVPVVFEGKRAIHVTIRDITERKRLEDELRQSHKMEAIGRLAGGVAHDFNNLLTAIIGYGDLALQQLDTHDPLYEEMSQIRKAANRAASLTKQLLAFSRRQVLSPTILNLNTVVSDMEKLLRRVIGEHITLATEYAGSPYLVRLDAGQLQQVIMNLVINARDAMPEGGRISITTAALTLESDSGQLPLAAGDYMALSVSDTGSGIDDETRQHLFEPFFTTKGPGAGTGLGLSTVYGIVKQSGAEIDVRSTPGEGTVFTVYFPHASGESAPEPETRAGMEQPAGTETILLVEDEEMVRSLAKLVLSRRGYRLVEASNGADALALAQACSGEIHLLVSDIRMPGMSGRDLAEQLLALRPGLKTLFISGYNEPAVNAGVFPDGSRFLQKPFSLDDLLTRVRAVLDGHPA